MGGRAAGEILRVSTVGKVSPPCIGSMFTQWVAVQLLKKVGGSFNKSQVLITHINPLKMVLQKVEALPFVGMSFNQSDPSRDPEWKSAFLPLPIDFNL